jgi:hypothetical protein
VSCFNCGSELPEGARFCPTCGAPVEGAAANALRPRISWELCEIGCWRGYLKADFYARRIGESGAEIARSDMFRRRRNDPPPREGNVLAAHEALVATLRNAGWEPIGQPRPWYAQRFRRQITGVYELTAEKPAHAEETGP